MVAKIGRGASLYGALKYNHDKVLQGTARVISGNRMPMEMTAEGSNHIQKTMFAFESYLHANRNTENPILHISLNPSPEDKLDDRGLAALAEQYMQKMGYGDQPYTVYLHEDTGRRHIHIVSTCVREDGTKISDRYEHNRSMKACRELEQEFGLKKIEDKKKEITEAYLQKADHKKGDLKRQVSNILKSVFTSYRFQTFGEYSALLTTFNIEAKQVKGEHAGKPYTGVVYSVTNGKGKVVSPPFKSSLFDKRFGDNGISKRIRHNAKEYREGKWTPKIRNEVALAMLGCEGKQKKFEKLLKGCGIDTVLRRNDEGRIYGTTFIDHNAREVYNGSRLGKEFSANAFEKLFNGDGKPDESLRERVFEKSETLDAGLGLFDFAPNPPDYEEENFARRMKRKQKKRKRGKSIT